MGNTVTNVTKSEITKFIINKCYETLIPMYEFAK